jgi:hypothetical protein
MRQQEQILRSSEEKESMALTQVNENIAQLGQYDYQLNEQIYRLQILFDDIRNVISEKKTQYEEAKKLQATWNQQADQIKTNYYSNIKNNVSYGAAGIGVGVAGAALGPTAAMGIATTFGVASTGTAISTLTGAAATKAALAWIGGGSLALGGGGIAAGETILSLCGPVGLAIAGISLGAAGYLSIEATRDKDRLDQIFTWVSFRNQEKYKLANVEINERIKRIKNACANLTVAIQRIQGFGLDYNAMPEAEQYELGSYVNLMTSSVQLLVNPIMGMAPNYTEADLDHYLYYHHDVSLEPHERDLVLVLADSFAKIDLVKTDWKLLWKALMKNKSFYTELGLQKNQLYCQSFQIAHDALKFKFHPLGGQNENDDPIFSAYNRLFER